MLFFHFEKPGPVNEPTVERHQVPSLEPEPAPSPSAEPLPAEPAERKAISSSQATDARRQCEPAQPRPAAERPKVPTLSRRAVQPAQTHIRLAELTEAKENADNRNERAALNAQRRAVLNQPLERREGPKKLTDLRGGLIGRIVQLPTPEPRTPESVVIGADELLRTVAFDFAARRDVTGKPIPGDLCIRVSAFLTEEGRERLARFLKKYLQRRSERRPEGRRHGDSLSGKEIRNILQRRDTFDIELDGLRAHASQRGKIELFIPLQRSVPPLTGLPQEQRQRDLFQKFTRFAMLKLWVSNTNPEFNQTVRDAFQALSIALREIIGPT